MRVSQVHYLQLNPGLQIPELSIVQPFRAVVVAEVEVDRDWQYEVSCWLVGNGCLYAICWGIDCIGWEDSIDHASITFKERKQTPGDHFLITTAHADEPISEAFRYAEYCAFEEHLPLDDVLILHLSNHDAENCLRSKYQASKTNE